MVVMAGGAGIGGLALAVAGRAVEFGNGFEFVAERILIGNGIWISGSREIGQPHWPRFWERLFGDSQCIAFAANGGHDRIS